MTLGIARPMLPLTTARPADPRNAGEDPARIRATIARAPLFAALPISAIEDLTARVSVRKVAVGSAVVAQDEPGDAMFVIMSGRVKVVIFGESGREVTLSLLRAGDSFGEMSLFDQGPRSAHCLAIEPTTLLVLSRDDLMKHMQAHPRTAINLVSEMARRLRRADETIAQLALCDVNERLIHRLVALGREEGASSPDGLVVRRRPTQQELANMIGSTRQSISISLDKFEKQGLVARQGNTIRILDVGGLRALCD